VTDVEIRILRPDDDRGGFRCGDEALDLFFHLYAGQNQFRHHIGVTYVAVDEGSGRIVGFVTVTPATLDADQTRTGKRMPPYPMPVLRVARLAVAEEAGGRGLGQSLLRFACELAETMRDQVGCVGLLVDAKPDAVEFYQRYGFVPVTAVEGTSPSVPRPQPMYLSLGSVPPPR
jgi:predicted N-acetyltransferase YhbS